MTNKQITVVDPALLDELKDLYPQEEDGYNRINLPRIAYVSQDVMEGEGKKKVCVAEAGTFFTERETSETDAEGKKIWDKTEIGREMEGIILYHRYQLSYYDEKAEEYTSSSVYDSSDEIIPLWKGKKQILKGTPAELKAEYMYTDPRDGKQKSNLKENRILYIWYKEELFQLNLHGTSMYSFLKYVRSVNPPAVITGFSSEPQENGATKWNMMTFKPARALGVDEVKDNLAKVREIRDLIGKEKGSSQKSTDDTEEVEFERLASPTPATGSQDIPF